MKRAITTLTATALVACVTCADLYAQNNTRQDPGSRRGANAGRLDSKTPGANIRVSQLMGYNIQNSQGESVGEIKDIVMDSETGKVSYVAVTYGGFLGVGNKLFAVPFEALKVKVDPNAANGNNLDADDYVLVLDVTQKQLEGQEGFDENNWPNMANKQWRDDLDKRYGIRRNMNVKDRLLRDSNQPGNNR